MSTSIRRYQDKSSTHEAMLYDGTAESFRAISRWIGPSVSHLERKNEADGFRLSLWTADNVISVVPGVFLVRLGDGAIDAAEERELAARYHELPMPNTEAPVEGRGALPRAEPEQDAQRLRLEEQFGRVVAIAREALQLAILSEEAYARQDGAATRAALRAELETLAPRAGCPTNPVQDRGRTSR